MYSIYHFIPPEHTLIHIKPQAKAALWALFSLHENFNKIKYFLCKILEKFDTVFFLWDFVDQIQKRNPYG